MAENKPSSAESTGEAEQPFISHLVELRDRLLRVVIVVIVVFFALLPFANTLFSVLAGPLMRHMPENSSMIATAVVSPLMIPIKLALVLAVFIAIPFILYQLWSFIAPGLYRHERRMAMPLLVSSTLLFYLGGVFAYFVVFPLIFAFLTTSAPEGVTVMTDISNYLDFVLTLFFAFGVAFEVPVATFVLVWMGLTTPDALIEKRPYIIVGAFVIGMLLTPPDVISQTLLAVPMWMLFELGVFMARKFVPQKRDDAEATAQAAVDQPSAGEELDAELERIEQQERESEPR